MPKFGILRASVRGQCPKGHSVSRFIPLRVVRPADYLNPEPCHFHRTQGNVPWLRISQIYTTARAVAMQFLDIRNNAMTQLHRDGAPITGISELFKIAPNSASVIVGRTRSDTPPKKPRRKQRRSRKSKNPADFVP